MSDVGQAIEVDEHFVSLLKAVKPGRYINRERLYCFYDFKVRYLVINRVMKGKF